MRRLVIGDIHGNYLGMKSALERSGFDPKVDTLYGIGDYVDGHQDSYKVVEYLIGLGDSFKGILGNHDSWLIDWLNNPRFMVDMHYSQGGKATGDSYAEAEKHLSMSEYVEKLAIHREFFKSLSLYFELENGDNKPIALVHGGWSALEGLGHQLHKDVYYWDRVLWENSQFGGMQMYSEIRTNNYSKVFLGHTTTERNYPDLKPVTTIHKIWNIDQGGGWTGKITVMDIDTLEYWQSDISKTYYPNYKGG